MIVKLREGSFPALAEVVSDRGSGRQARGPGLGAGRGHQPVPGLADPGAGDDLPGRQTGPRHGQVLLDRPQPLELPVVGHQLFR